MRLTDAWRSSILVRRDVLHGMLLLGAASGAACDSPRSWGGFGESAPLRTSTSIRLSVQVLRDNEPTCSLRAWACAVPPSVIQHSVLLGRDSWMRFNTRSYRAMNSRPHDNRVSASWCYPATPRQACQLMPEPPQLPAVVSTSSMMALWSSPCRTSLSCLRST